MGYQILLVQMTLYLSKESIIPKYTFPLLPQGTSSLRYGTIPACISLYIPICNFIPNSLTKNDNNDDDDNNNNNNDNILDARKYWVDVQQGIISSHGERDPL